MIESEKNKIFEDFSVQFDNDVNDVIKELLQAFDILSFQVDSHKKRVELTKFKHVIELELLNIEDLYIAEKSITEVNEVYNIVTRKTALQYKIVHFASLHFMRLLLINFVDYNYFFESSINY